MHPGEANEHRDWPICINLARCLIKQAQILYKTEDPGLGFSNREHAPDLRLPKPGVIYFMFHGRVDNCSTFMRSRPSLAPIPSQLPIVATSISTLSDQDQGTMIRPWICPGSTCNRSTPFICHVPGQRSRIWQEAHLSAKLVNPTAASHRFPVPDAMANGVAYK